MRASQQLSCSNCWFNGLQHGSMGLSTGYCVEHRVVLRRADETTCGRHLRKDLMIASARSQQETHRLSFGRVDGVQLLRTADPVDNGMYLERDTSFLRQDRVGDAVADYGELGSTIESLAILRGLRTLRGDLALLSLGRSYTNRCVSRGGRWTSGIHLLWWAQQRLQEQPVPKVEPEDLRYATATKLERQVDLAQWSMLMLRLVFISDVGSHAATQGDEVGQLADLAERAALESQTLSARTLARWVKNKGIAAINAALPERRYNELAVELHRERDR